MLRKALIAGLSTVAAAALSAAPANAASYTYPDTHYVEADELVSNLNSIAWPSQETYNTYSNSTPLLTWGTNGTPTSYRNRSRCASFVTEVFKHTFSWATPSYFQTSFGSTSPFAADYYNTIKTASVSDHFARIGSVSILRRGDIIAIKYNDGGSGGSGEATGHVMIVQDKHQYDRDGDPDTTEWAVRVVDSTSNPHGAAETAQPGSPYLSYPDTRSVPVFGSAGDDEEYNGAGRGWIFIQVVNNRATGYWWGANENTFYSVANRPMAMGRVVESTSSQTDQVMELNQ
ncbi:hypothetical protein Aph01nite_29510 [Acrocarpospora phusangensis]|uniref:Peptidase C51 domain-containing protein n=1 Tax=Acrocarpospora phusangensis TaxID=1070424 RepID=A0A919Q9F0_9ACTN|nr:hypothetical protein [Acrocarpospora phusangensis]GIH24641.1 hypothetical protein Aph01nite_29510 [Acrocarpospora phusangensis]